MKTTVPGAFVMPFRGPEGSYSISFEPTGEWDGRIDVSIGGVKMQWDVVDADRDNDGSLVLGGMTTGSEEVWNDQFWFELRLKDSPPVIRYWGDKVIWREDQAA
jgi:hypothetical protein